MPLCHCAVPWNQGNHFDTARPHGSKGPLCHCGAKENIVILLGLMEQRSVVILWDLVEPRGNCDDAEPQGSKNMEQTWLTWPPHGFLTGPPDLGMLRDASYMPLKTWISVLSLLWERIVFLLQGFMAKNRIPPPKLKIPQDCS